MFHLDLGGGLELRLLEESDADEVFRAVERNREQLREWLPWVDRTVSAEEPRQYILLSLQQYANREALAAGIFVAGSLAGAIGLHKMDARNRSTSSGYWLDAQYQGRGIVTRACRAMVSHAFAEYELHRLEIRCATGNVKSCAIPRRLGFVREGVLRDAEWVNGQYLDLVVWGMLARDWKG
jgi:ribosomal-protein-serine acetyltransferase